MKAILHEAVNIARFRSAKRLGAILAIGALSVSIPLGGASAQSGELPDGPGKDLTAENCTICHGPELITMQRRSPAEWEEVVNRMMANGAMMPPDQYDQVLAYLGTYLGKETASKAKPAGGSQTAHAAQ